MEQQHPTPSRHLAARIRTIRTERGWSAQQLSERCTALGQRSLTRSTLAKIEAGNRGAVTFDEAVAIATAFGVPLADLAPPSPEPTGTPPPGDVAPGTFYRLIGARRGGRVLIEDDVGNLYLAQSAAR